jgi:hypothetical protein
MFEIILTVLGILVLGVVALVCTSVFVAYITQAQYIDEHEFGGNDDD